MPRTVEVVFDHFPALAAKMPEAVRQIVQETILAIETGAKLKCPVDTGALRASLVSEMTGDTSGQVATNIEYSTYVEFGTSKMGARPYMTPAAEAERRHYMKKMTELEGRLE